MRYLFIFGDDNTTKVIAEDLKRAIYEAGKYIGISSDVFKKALNGFDKTDVKGMIELFNHFSRNYDNDIVAIYEITNVIFEAEIED